jgi:hypothetical protein
MSHRLLAISMAAGLLAAAPTFLQGQGAGQAIVTVLPKHAGEISPNVSEQDLQSVKVNGKQVKVTSWVPLRDPQNGVELVILIDSSARSSLGRQTQDIEQFVGSLPPNIKAGIAYMQNGHASFSGPLTTDHAEILRALHLPVGGPGSSGSPYFCLSDLARNWPSRDRSSRHEVLMVTDGVDTFQRRLDLDDPYVRAAITDSVRAGLVVFSIYWKSQGAADNNSLESGAGQSLLSEVSQATGGASFWQGSGNPVSFQPYFDELTRRLHNQYELGFSAPIGGKPEVESFKLKLSVPGSEVDAPQQVLVVPAGAAKQ